MTSPRALHVTSFVGKSSFGIGPIVLGLAANQINRQALDWRTQIWSFDTASEARDIEVEQGMRAGAIRSFPITGPRWLGYSRLLEKQIITEAADFDIIHEHGIWTCVSHAVNTWREYSHRPTVIAPHGSLDAWALKRSLWKKRLALWEYERKNLQQASCLQAGSLYEAAGFRAFGLRSPIAILPNGISEAWLESRGDALAFRRAFNLSPETNLMLFLGRITPKKGIPMLLQAMAVLRDRLETWKLIIAGVDEFGHQRQIQHLVEELNLQPYVQFVGPFYGQDKRNAFAAANLFVLPSYSEGAPIAILEALGAGVPVLTTKASPWEDIVIHRCGWWTDVSEQAITAALLEALQQTGTLLDERGERGKDLIRRQYTWHQIAGQALNLYEWLLGRGQRPNFVIVD